MSMMSEAMRQAVHVPVVLAQAFACELLGTRNELNVIIAFEFDAYAQLPCE